jgi:hypothetical protein
MSRWDPRSEDLLARARAANPVPSGAKGRVRETLSGSIAVAAAGSAIGFSTTAYAKLPVAVEAAGAAMPGAASALAPLAPTAFLAPVTIGLALGLSAISPSEAVFPQRTPPATASGAQQATRHPPPVEAKVVLHSEQQQPSTEPRQTVQTNVATAGPSKPKPEPHFGLKQEATAIEHARVVLRQGDAELALRLLDGYRNEFPDGVLSFEALATRAVALCRLGQISEAFGILARLEQTAPGSGSVAQARAACGAAAIPRQRDP